MGKIRDFYEKVKNYGVDLEYQKADDSPSTAAWDRLAAMEKRVNELPVASGRDEHPAVLMGSSSAATERPAMFAPLPDIDEGLGLAEAWHREYAPFRDDLVVAREQDSVEPFRVTDENIVSLTEEPRLTKEEYERQAAWVYDPDPSWGLREPVKSGKAMTDAKITSRFGSHVTPGFAVTNKDNAVIGVLGLRNEDGGLYFYATSMLLADGGYKEILAATEKLPRLVEGSVEYKETLRRSYEAGVNLKGSRKSMTEAQQNASEDGFMAGFEGKLGVAPTELNDTERAAWEEGYQMAQRVAVPNGRPDGFEGVARYKDESKASSYAYVVFDDAGKRPKEVASLAAANKIAADYNRINPGSRAVPLTSREYASAGGATGKWGQPERPKQQARGLER
jgi:hypothetical protein